MKKNVTQQIIWLVIVITAIIFLFWAVNDILAPFIIGAVIAYCLDPLADRMQILGIPRLITALSIISSVIILLMVLTIFLFPILYNQLSQLLALTPEILKTVKMKGGDLFGLLNSKVLEDIQLSSFEKSISEVSPVFLKSLFKSSFAILDFMILLVITPIVAIYLLLDWDDLVNKIEKFIPIRFKKMISEIGLDMHQTLASFLRGQIVVCLILAIFYASSLTILGLKYGILIGIFSGLISFIPIVGALLGGFLAFIICLYQYWDFPIWIAGTMSIFLVGQFFEGNILTPRLVGKAVKLHPLWIIFSVTFFGTYLGWIGIVMAVPLAACLAVLIRFFLGIYFDSDFYKS